MLTQCTGGIGVYNSLWGPALLHANHCYNRVPDSEDNIPYEALTEREYVWGKADLVFGQEVIAYTPTEIRTDGWDNPGQRAIWVGRDPTVAHGNMVVPIKWSGQEKQWTLGTVTTMLRE